MTVHCLKPDCCREWPRDPALEVACPTCRAEVGRRCRRPSGHPVFRETGGLAGVHADRDIQAAKAGHYGKCPSGRCGLHRAERRGFDHHGQPDLFAGAS